ncbi:pyruvate, phosphate dikinase [bacterium]|nr:MAG: pyruvate, phosphate dikinase [bacterium]
MAKPIFFFGDGRADGHGGLKALLGGKGAGLAEMSRAGAPVPPGFTITTEVCRAHRRAPGRAVPGLERALRRLERSAGRRLGDAQDPLLVSVRSGAKFSMPGMMDTVLNLGLNAVSVEGLAARSGDRAFALDTFRRLVTMFGNVVMGVPKERFESPREAGAEAALGHALEVFRRETRREFPEDPREQLRAAVEAVFKSWDNPRAVTYRRANGIPDDLGTACTVQAMVFGNRGGRSGTGVGFTRNPATGAKEPYGEYLADAQGEDVVSGAATPMPLKRLKRAMPEVYRRLLAVTSGLERRLRDAQDYEFTVERGRLYLLQTRAAKRTAAAALRIAVDMTRERLITREEALLRVDPAALDQLLKPVFDEKARRGHATLAKGLPAGPGAATGHIAFSADAAVSAAKRGPVLLVRPETNPDDIHGMMAAQGILTATGGLTSHAAVVGRGMGKVCVVGCGDLDIGAHSLKVGGRTFKEGDYLSIDGFTGEVLLGEVPTQPSEVLRCLEGTLAPSRSVLFRYYSTFMRWADAARRLKVRANADRPGDAREARLLGAEGIGLCRTEHMFFGEKRLPKMLAMIVAETPQERERALGALFPLQKEDFKGLLREMAGLPVTIRFFDPPLHEFLPHGPEEAQRRAAAAGVDPGKVWDAARRLKEMNPMMGHRGCRLGVTHPEITLMQARAVLAAARELKDEGVSVSPEIMIPLVGYPSEYRHQAALVAEAAKRVPGSARLAYSVGTMIEVPRACVVAEAIARDAEFFSFGTNDLTQMTLGYSRDDYGKFIREYLELGLLPRDPFAGLDEVGVGELVRMAVTRGRKGRPGLKCGVCGEHGGDPASIGFFHRAGLDYVSCSPYRVPAARLAAAQAAIREKRAGKAYTTA